MLIKDADIVGYGPWLKFVWNGHITNWFWRDSQSRRLTRQKHYIIMKDTYFKKYIPFIESLRAEDSVDPNLDPATEKIFTLWFQGLENAPKVVKACIKSIREMYGDRLVILDEKSMPDYISLPSYIMDKWHNKKIIPANFSDIVRIELLYKYGGFWFDATDFLLSPIPEVVENADFFMYVVSPTLYTHMFVQTCFMRAKKGDPLLKMWRSLVFEYWNRENRAADYFLVHMLFKALVTYNPEAKRLYEEMPKLYQDNLHKLWYEYGHEPYDPTLVEKLKEISFFQKCSYRYLKHTVNSIKEGTLADFLINRNSKQ